MCTYRNFPRIIEHRQSYIFELDVLGVCVEVLQFNYKAVSKLQVSEENTQPWKSSMVAKKWKKGSWTKGSKILKVHAQTLKGRKKGYIWTEEKIKVSELYSCCVLWPDRSKPDWNFAAISRNR